MERFDNFMKCLGRILLKIICTILQVIGYTIVWMIAYGGFKEFSRSPYTSSFFSTNRHSDIVERIPPELFIRLEEVLPYEYSSVELFCGFLACITVILVFAIVQLPRIVGKMNKTRKVYSQTIPYLAIILEAILIPIVYYININMQFTWFIIKDFLFVLIALAIFNFPNYIMSLEKDYGWINFLLINLLIALSFGIISAYCLYSLIKITILIIVILAILNLFIPIF